MTPRTPRYLGGARRGACGLVTLEVLREKTQLARHISTPSRVYACQEIEGKQRHAG